MLKIVGGRIFLEQTHTRFHTLHTLTTPHPSNHPMPWCPLDPITILQKYFQILFLHFILCFGNSSLTWRHQKRKNKRYSPDGIWDVWNGTKTAREGISRTTGIYKNISLFLGRRLSISATCWHASLLRGIPCARFSTFVKGSNCCKILVANTRDTTYHKKKCTDNGRIGDWFQIYQAVWEGGYNKTNFERKTPRRLEFGPVCVLNGMSSVVLTGKK